MFCSQSLLSKKGPLGTIWLAAYFYKKLKKDQIVGTSITSSVDKIITEVHVSYRILAQLLLGVVRIFSKKVEILYHDCNEALSNVRKMTSSSIRLLSYKAIAAPHSYQEASAPQQVGKLKREARHVTENIITPSNDETVDEQSSLPEESTVAPPSNNEVADEQISLLEESTVAPYRSCTIIIPEKLTLDSFEVEVPEEGDTVDTHQYYSIEGDEQDDWHFFSNKHLKEAGLDFGFNSACFTPVRDVHSSDMIGIALQINDLHCSNILETREEPRNDLTQLEDHDIVPESTKSLSIRVDANAMEEVWHLRKLPQPRHLDLEKSVPEKGYSKDSLPTTHDEASVPRAAGAVSPEFAVRTPAKREQNRLSRKRKCLCDETIVLSNETFREGIHNSSSLVFKRRKAPLTALGTWKSYILADLERAFTEQLIPCNHSVKQDTLFQTLSQIKHDWDQAHSTSDAPPIAPADKPLELRDLSAKKTFYPEILTETAKAANDAQANYHGSSLEQEHSLYQHAPINVPGPGASLETQVASKLDERREEPSASIASDLSRSLDISSLDDVAIQKGGFSVRTRSVARYLCKSFQKRKDQNGNLNLTKILDRRNRTACATFFYETLVLKSQGCIEVIQEVPYADIMVSANPILWQVT